MRNEAGHLPRTQRNSGVSWRKGFEEADIRFVELEGQLATHSRLSYPFGDGTRGFCEFWAFLGDAGGGCATAVWVARKFD